MKVKKPSISGEQHTGYLGHFAKDKFIQQGHNDGPGPSFFGSLRGRDSTMAKSVEAYGRQQKEKIYAEKAASGQLTEAEKTAEANRKQREAEAKYAAMMQRREEERRAAAGK